jgi:hypothetical protein
MEIFDWFYLYEVVSKKVFERAGRIFLIKEFKPISRIRQEYFAVRRMVNQNQKFKIPNPSSS